MDENLFFQDQVLIEIYFAPHSSDLFLSDMVTHEIMFCNFGNQQMHYTGSVAI